MEDPTIRAALGAGWRAALRSAWLAPVGMVVALARGALLIPPAAFAGWMLLRGATQGMARGGALPEAVWEGALAVAAAPRFLAILGGLWLAGLLLGAALRVAYLAGALPSLGGALAQPGGGEPQFAVGVAWRFPRVAGTALLAFCIDLTGSGFALTLAGAAVVVLFHPPAFLPWPAVAGLAALASTLALLVPLALSILGDAALVRAALRDESPGRAMASALVRFARRPAAFLLATLLVGAIGLLLIGSLRSMANLAAVLHPGSAPLLPALGMQMLVSALVAVLGAFAELWRLAALSVLAAAE